MNATNPPFVATPISAAVVAVLTIAQAVPAIDKRLGRVSEVESQIGRVPRVVRNFYVRVQRFYKIALIGITIVGIVMVLAFIFPDRFRNSWLSEC